MARLNNAGSIGLRFSDLPIRACFIYAHEVHKEDVPVFMKTDTNQLVELGKTTVYSVQQNYFVFRVKPTAFTITQN